MTESKSQTTERRPGITFRGMLLFDAIMNENGCNKRMCAYERGCVCWREWIVTVKELSHAN